MLPLPLLYFLVRSESYPLPFFYCYIAYYIYHITFKQISLIHQLTRTLTN